jgi:Transposase DDE domain
MVPSSTLSAVRKSVRERAAVKRYLDELEQADQNDEVVIDPSAVSAALEKLNRDPEPEARFLRMANGYAPAYKVQTAVDAEPAIIVAQQVTTEAADNRSLLPMAEAAKQALANPETRNVVADAGYSNGEQAAQCEAQGIVPHVPANRSINNQGGGKLFDRARFVYDEKTDTFRCPAQPTLVRKQLSRKDRCIMYAAEARVCGACALKQRCTSTSRRWIRRHLHEDTLQKMNRRATPQLMRMRRSTVERPFAVLKYLIFGYPRFLLRGLAGAQVETSFATLAYNLKTMIRVLGGRQLVEMLAR